MTLRVATRDDIKTYVEMGVNVLLIAAHGTGKSTMLESVCKELGYKCVTLNAALIDPYLNFLGVPNISEDERGRKFMELIRDKGIDDAHVIFLDEINRAPSAVLNALMNLINDRRINNEYLPNLKCVVAASNPSEDESTGLSYSVGHLDPAQRDRFDVVMTIRPHLDYTYLSNALRGMHKNSDQIADVVCRWYSKLKFTAKDDGGNTNKKRSPYVSPRKMERMLQLFLRHPDPSLEVIQHVLGEEADSLPCGSLYKKILGLTSDDPGSLLPPLERLYSSYNRIVTDDKDKELLEEYKKYIVENYEILMSVSSAREVKEMIKELDSTYPLEDGKIRKFASALDVSLREIYQSDEIPLAVREDDNIGNKKDGVKRVTHYWCGYLQNRTK